MRKTLLLAVLGILFLPAMARGQVTVQLAPSPRQQFFSASGAPLASGCILTSNSGTNTPLPAYTDSTGTQQLPNPIILDAGGFATIFLSNNSYRFTVTAYDGIPGNKCAAGVQQYLVDGINAYGPISTGANLFLLGQSSDPAGTGGEMIYRNDIPCIRFFTTLWDCAVTLTATQTISNKTFTSPTINTPTITTAALNGVTSVGGLQAFQASGSTLQIGGGGTNPTTILGGNDTISPGNVNITAGNATGAGIGASVVITAGSGGNLRGGAVSITGGAGTANNANGGNVSLVPGAPNGNGTAGFIGLLGIVNNYNNLATVSNGIPAEYGQGNQTGLGANVSTTGLFAVPSTGAGLYRVSCYVIVTTAATTSSTLPSCNIIWVDKDNANSQSANVTATSAGNTVTTYTQGQTIIDVAASTSVTWTTAGYATSGATSMVYAVHIRIEAL